MAIASVPLSLRIARLLLAAAAALAVGTAAYIAAQSQEPVAASPWIALLVLTATGFVAAAVQLTREPRRARLLAIGSAVGVGALGTITGFGAGMLSFPAAGVGALAAWAVLLHPPRRPLLIAFALYVVIGIAINAAMLGTWLAYPWFAFSILIWPLRLFLFPAASGLPTYLALGLAVSIVLIAYLPRDRTPAGLTVGGWGIASAAGVLGGAAAVAAFEVIAIARATTSLRYELDPLVLAVVFLGGLATAYGALSLRLRPGAPSAVALGLGAAALFMTFTYRPAVTCERNGVGTSPPLAWTLRDAVSFRGTPWGMSEGGESSSYGGTVGGTTPSTTTGEMRSAGRSAVYRCEGDHLVDFRVTTQ